MKMGGHYKKEAESEMIQTYLMRGEYLNRHGRMQAGVLMGWICETADLTAGRHSGTEVMVTAVDHHMFSSVLKDCRRIIARGAVIRAGESLMDVQIDVWAEDLCGGRKMVSRAYVTLAAVDEKLQPVRIPGIIKGKLKGAIGK